MSTETLPQRQELLLTALMDAVPGDADIEWSEWSAGADRTQLVAQKPLGDGIHFITTLGSLGHHVFTIVSDGDPEKLSGLLTSIERFDAVNARLGMGETFRTDDPFLLENGVAAILFVWPSASRALEKIPDELVLPNAKYHVMLCIPLSPDDFAVKKDEGLEALVMRFQKEQRDIVRWNVGPPLTPH